MPGKEIDTLEGTMSGRRLYVVYGMGRDSVGLVGAITAPIAKSAGNILDLRQDVLHGMFTIFMVVDLSESKLRKEDFVSMVGNISEQTGLSLSVDTYSPVPRDFDKKNLLMILVGVDREGIIATIAELLGKYKINIEFAKTVAREGVFLMELLTDVSNCTIPFDNLTVVLRQNMDAMKIKTIFQPHDVFNKKKRIVLFDITKSFIDKAVMDEIGAQTGVSRELLLKLYSPVKPFDSLQAAASRLESLPYEIVNTIVEKTEVTLETVELFQTLKILGYKIVLVSTAFTFFTDFLKRKLDLDYAYGAPLGIDDDTKTFVGEFHQGNSGCTMETIIADLAQKESVSREDITVICDADFGAAPGIKAVFDMGTIIEYVNKRIITKDNLAGVLGSFGIPVL